MDGFVYGRFEGKPLRERYFERSIARLGEYGLYRKLVRAAPLRAHTEAGGDRSGQRRR
jgi:hypothetical protein